MCHVGDGARERVQACQIQLHRHRKCLALRIGRRRRRLTVRPKLSAEWAFRAIQLQASGEKTRIAQRQIEISRVGELWRGRVAKQPVVSPREREERLEDVNCPGRRGRTRGVGRPRRKLICANHQGHRGRPSQPVAGDLRGLDRSAVQLAENGFARVAGSFAPRHGQVITADGGAVERRRNGRRQRNHRDRARGHGGRRRVGRKHFDGVNAAVGSADAFDGQSGRRLARQIRAVPLPLISRTFASLNAERESLPGVTARLVAGGWVITGGA